MSGHFNDLFTDFSKRVNQINSYNKALIVDPHLVGATFVHFPMRGLFEYDYHVIFNEVFIHHYMTIFYERESSTKKVNDMYYVLDSDSAVVEEYVSDFSILPLVDSWPFFGKLADSLHKLYLWDGVLDSMSVYCSSLNRRVQFVPSKSQL